MILSFEDIHGNKKEEELTLSDSDKLIVRFTKEVTPKQIDLTMGVFKKFMNAGPGAVLPVPHYVEFIVVKVTT